jgi:DNA polymerase III epsilon subunit-like protein
LAEVYITFISPHRLVFLDIETDSLNTSAANILQISLLEIECNNNPINPLVIKNICNSYIKPHPNYIINKNDQSTKIHQITQSQINNAPQFNEIAMDIADQLVSTTLVGFNIQCFDIPILCRHLQNSGEDPGWTAAIDLGQAYWKSYPSTLENALKMLDIQHKPLHNAQNDVTACIDLFAKLVNLNKLPKDPQGFQTLLNDTHQNSTKFGRSIIQINEHPTHPWITKNHWNQPNNEHKIITNTDIEMMDTSPISNPEPHLPYKRQYSPIVLEDRKYKKRKMIT